MFVKFMLAIIVGWIIGSLGLINIIIILRFGIPMCNKYIREELDEQGKVIALRKKYKFALIFWIIITTVATFLFCRFLNDVFIVYLITLVVGVLLGIKSTGENQNNISDFEESLDKID